MRTPSRSSSLKPVNRKSTQRKERSLYSDGGRNSASTLSDSDYEKCIRPEILKLERVWHKNGVGEIYALPCRRPENLTPVHRQQITDLFPAFHRRQPYHRRLQKS